MGTYVDPVSSRHVRGKGTVRRVATGRSATETQAERTWLGVGVSLGIGGAALIASTAAASLSTLSNPALYLGIALCLVAAYVGVGVFAATVPLPKLPSERSFERFHDGIEPLLVEALTLNGDIPVSEPEWEAWQREVTNWTRRTVEWLSVEVSKAQALAFESPTPVAARIRNSYNKVHNDQRLVLRWRIRWLEQLKDAGP